MLGVVFLHLVLMTDRGLASPWFGKKINNNVRYYFAAVRIETDEMLVLFGTSPLTIESGCFNSHRLISWGAVDASSCQERSCLGKETHVDAAIGARLGPVCRHSGVFRA